MAVRYTPDELKYLRESPLVVKPSGLPPAEQWMGPPVDAARNATRLPNERSKNHEPVPLSEQNRRPTLERHISRNSANPEDIILGPPKTSFMSSTSIRSSNKTFESPDRPGLREAESRDRFSFRNKSEIDSDRLREGRGNTVRQPKRADGDQDSDGWSTVKPRKSFGTEGAERFNGRMGVDRTRDDKRFKEREERDTKEKPRGFENYSRDVKTSEHDQERETRRNGAGRGRTEPTWRDRENKDRESDLPPAPRDRNSNGDRYVDRNRGWREKDRDDAGDRTSGRNDRGDRRWGDRDRYQRDDPEPEWMDEPSDEKSQAHTQEDFQKWKEQMHLDKSGGGKPDTGEDSFKPDAGASFFGLEKPKVETPLSVETGPDKFFGMWSSKEDVVSDTVVDSKKEGAAKAKTMGRASRFTSFFSPQEESQGRQTEPPPPMPAPPLQNGLEALFGAGKGNTNDSHSSAEKAAFQQLLQKLQQQTVSSTGSTPPPNINLQQRPPLLEKFQSNVAKSPDSFQQYRSEPRDEGRPTTRGSQQPSIQDILAQRQMAGSQPSIRPEQMLQELVGQRQNALSQTSVRPDQPPSRNNNTEFLMGLMQSAKAMPDPQRSEQVLLRMQPKSAERQMQQQMMEREQQEMAREAAAHRERNATQRRPGPPPGFYDENSFQRGPPPQERQSGIPPQPTQILQRPPPPGLDMGWERPPPQHRPNLPPPPGLAGAPSRVIPIQQQQMFPPGFQVNAFPPPEAMAGPPRNIMQPPPGMGGFFGGPPPPGFMPPGMSGFQGPDMAYGAPFDGRGPPPPGSFRRQ